MHKMNELLLLETVDNLGIVGDVVKVRSGYARNYLVPMGLATVPSEELVKSLASKRAQAEKHQREVRVQREQMIEKLEGLEIELVRSCNDQGLLYGSVTQGDIADALSAKGYNVKAREVRLPQTIKRVETHHISVKLDKDLEAEVTVKVVPDRELQADDRDEVEVDEEGNMIQKDARPAKRGKKRAEAESAADAE